MKILIDNGHGKNTPGKRSPDGKLLEYKYAREISKDIVDTLTGLGYDAELLTPEEIDISLSERVRRANKFCKIYGASNVALISVHCNAAGNGSTWTNATGWEAWTSKGTTKSDKLADLLYARAKLNLKDAKIRTDWTDGDLDKEAGFFILKYTDCPAVLTENFFMDNKSDVEYMLSEEGRHQIVRTHVEALIEWAKRN